MPPMRHFRILLVEDHDFTRSTVAAALRVEGCIVVASVSSARDAMRAVMHHSVDCAVLDLNLGPGPSGVDLAYGLREHDPSMGIVLLTNYRDPRLLTGDPRPLPRGAQRVVKDDVRSTAQLRQAIDIAMGEAVGSATRSAGRLPLTNTQMEILRMVADGLTNVEIAERRGVSERSVQMALSRILANLEIESMPGVNPRVQLVNHYHALSGGSGAA